MIIANYTTGTTCYNIDAGEKEELRKLIQKLLE